MASKPQNMQVFHEKKKNSLGQGETPLSNPLTWLMYCPFSLSVYCLNPWRFCLHSTWSINFLFLFLQPIPMIFFPVLQKNNISQDTSGLILQNSMVFSYLSSHWHLTTAINLCSWHIFLFRWQDTAFTCCFSILISFSKIKFSVVTLLIKII